VGEGTMERGRFRKWGEILKMNVKYRPPAFSTFIKKNEKTKITRRKKDGRGTEESLICRTTPLAK
jgi:hypothetical protein